MYIGNPLIGAHGAGVRLVRDRLEAKTFANKEDALAEIAMRVITNKREQINPSVVVDVTNNDVHWEIVHVYVRYVWGAPKDVSEEVASAVNEQLRKIRAEYIESNKSNLDAAKDAKGFI